ncbi:MAG TPA: diguanylate cyclase [Gallionella sp.]|nr:diguanylate cyclase [Gallionella sp.]
MKAPAICGDNALPKAEFLQLAFDRLGDGVLWFDPEARVVYANESAGRTLECSTEELRHYRMRDIDPAFSEESWREQWEKAKTRDSFTLETQLLSKSGRIIPVEMTINYFSYRNNEFNCAIVRDISGRKRLEESTKLAAAIYRSSSEAVMVTDENKLIVDINPAFTRITGYTLDELHGRDHGILRSNFHDHSFYQEMWKAVTVDGYWQGEVWDRRKDGELFASYVTISLIRNDDGDIFRYVAQFLEITEKKRRDELIWQYANYDMLTGLPNRRLFYDRLGQEIKRAKRIERQLALLFIDLDGFKQINDRFGHDNGDLLLAESARRIIKCVRETDTVARLGGDEFTVILTDIGSRSDIERIALSISENLNEPFMLENGPGVVSASIGAALYPVDAPDAAELLKCADRAMYEAKRKGRKFCLCDGTGTEWHCTQLEPAAELDMSPAYR